MTFAPPTAPSTEPTKSNKGAWAFGAFIVTLAALVGLGALAKKDTPATPSTPVELCAAMSDGSASNLTPGDWQRLGDFSSHGLLVAYVTLHCPEQLARVDG